MCFFMLVWVRLKILAVKRWDCAYALYYFALNPKYFGVNIRAVASVGVYFFH